MSMEIQVFKGSESIFGVSFEVQAVFRISIESIECLLKCLQNIEYTVSISTNEVLNESL